MHGTGTSTRGKVVQALPRGLRHTLGRASRPPLCSLGQHALSYSTAGTDMQEANADSREEAAVAPWSSGNTRVGSSRPELSTCDYLCISH